ncbi:hypothetical protein Salat_0634000 [Sesamum alatum]|uniref:RNase H type-1 domain-containing protein n=1 Tax=Sesamum alatum TaxID=300844 RepID=A0AAE1YR84_9LAMI|nr:hypothetical protein Salat_0634000 [Sesamum alatum]
MPDVTGILRGRKSPSGPRGSSTQLRERCNRVLVLTAIRLGLKQTWALSNLLWRIISNWFNSVRGWFYRVSRELDHAQFDLFAMICWSSWSRRNQKAMEAQETEPLACVDGAIKLLHDFRNVVTKPTVDTPHKHHWTAPKIDEVKINFDVVMRSSTPGAGLGTIARNYEGRCIAWRTTFHPDIGDPEHGEALAARLAMEICVDFGWPKCIVEGDCIFVIQKIVTSREDMSSISPVVQDILRLGHLKNSVSYNWIRRDANSVAHLLVKATASSEERLAPPEFLFDTLRADARTDK